MRVVGACLALLIPLGAACTEPGPRPSLTALSPNQSYEGADITLQIAGKNLVPANDLDPYDGRHRVDLSGFRLQLGKGSNWTDLSDITWLSTDNLSALLSDADQRALGPGTWELHLVDPRGMQASLEDAFTTLGRDQTPPQVEILSPGQDTPLAAGMPFSARFRASEDGPARMLALYWTYREAGAVVSSGSCSPASRPSNTIDCTKDLTITSTLPAGTSLRLEVEAYDSELTRNAAIRDITLQPRPSGLSVLPAYGGTGGGTEILIRGIGLIPGTRASIDGVLLAPEGGVVQNNDTLVGHVPPHAPGRVTVTVESPVGTATAFQAFEYRSAPTLISIAPAAAHAGDALTITGQNFTENTRIFLGASLVTATPLDAASRVDDRTILGIAPAGWGRTTLWAFDAELGVSSLLNAFQWVTP